MPSLNAPNVPSALAANRTRPGRPSLQREVGSGMKGAPDVPQSSCSLLATSWHASGLMSPPLCLFLGLLSRYLYTARQAPLSMHGLSQNATRSPTDRWGLKQWGAVQTRRVRACVYVCDGFLADYVPTAISSFPSVCIDLGGWPVGQALSITTSRPIMLTDTSVESTPCLLIAPMPMFMWKAESR